MLGEKSADPGMTGYPEVCSWVNMKVLNTEVQKYAPQSFRFAS